MKKYKKFLSLLLIIAISLMSSFPIYAEESHSDYKKVQSQIKRITYTINASTIHEYALFEFHGKEIEWNRIIEPSGHFSAVIQSSSERSTTQGSCNYEEVKNIAEAYMNVYKDVAPLRGTEVSGSNLKHMKLGTTTSTLTHSDIERLGGLVQGSVALVTYLASAGFSATVAGILANIAWTNLTSDFPDKVVYQSTAYEVRFISDNNYYIHCYHMTAKAYESGSIKQTVNDYTQAIGG
ncbi:MAG TPA: hypothetical protein DIW34_00090 [Oribacterium sp.]|nr:hypothetical protein [Oribacterium sp.]